MSFIPAPFCSCPPVGHPVYEATIEDAPEPDSANRPFPCAGCTSWAWFDEPCSHADPSRACRAPIEAGREAEARTTRRNGPSACRTACHAAAVRAADRGAGNAPAAERLVILCGIGGGRLRVTAADKVIIRGDATASRGTQWR
jgi:hypothetical protein